MSPWVKYQIAYAQILMHVCAGSDNVMSSYNKKIASIIGPRIFFSWANEDSKYLQQVWFVQATNR